MGAGLGADADIRRIIRRRNSWMAWNSVLALGLFGGGGIVAARLSGSRTPYFAPGVLLLALGFSCIACWNLFAIMRPLRYESGPLQTHRSPGLTLTQAVGFMIAGLGGMGLGLNWGIFTSAILMPFGGIMVGMGILQLPSLFDPSVILTVDAMGFFDRRFTRRPVPWSDLPPLQSSSFRAGWPVFVYPRDPENSTLMRRVYLRLGFPFLYLGQDVLDASGGDILLAIHSHAPALTADLIALPNS